MIELSLINITQSQLSHVIVLVDMNENWAFEEFLHQDLYFIANIKILTVSTNSGTQFGTNKELAFRM